MSGTSFCLFADAGDLIITLLVLLGSFFVWLYNQIKSSADEQKKPRGAGSNLEEEMRKALQPGTPPSRPPQRKQRPPVRESKPAPSRPAARSRQPLASEESEWDRPVAVAQHVKQHLDAGEFDQRTGSLGQLSHLDDTVEDHVHDAFDHEVASIGAEGGVVEETTEEGATESSTTARAAAGIAVILSDPDQLRSAIILQEILRRPTWE